MPSAFACTKTVTNPQFFNKTHFLQLTREMINKQTSLHATSYDPTNYENVEVIKYLSIQLKPKTSPSILPKPKPFGILNNDFEATLNYDSVSLGIYANIDDDHKLSLKQDQKNVRESSPPDYVDMDQNINKHKPTQKLEIEDSGTVKTSSYVDVDDVDMCLGYDQSKCHCEFKPLTFNPKAISEDVYPFIKGQCYCYVSHVKKTEENEIYHSCENILNDPDSNELYDSPDMVLETFDKDEQKTSRHINCVIS